MRGGAEGGRFGKVGREMQLKEGIGMEKKGRKNRTCRETGMGKGQEWSQGMKEGWGEGEVRKGDKMEGKKGM